ncbi:MAG: argininosuccinate lyase, partial [Actinomycetota bacterium]
MGERQELSSTPGGSRMLWGGRFSGAPDEAMLRLTASIAVDLRLLEQDLAATRAHARGLAEAGLLDPAEVEAVAAACSQILDEHRAGALMPGADDEDVHSFVER